MLKIKIVIGADSFTFKGPAHHFEAVQVRLTEWYARIAPTTQARIEFAWGPTTEQPATRPLNPATRQPS